MGAIGQTGPLPMEHDLEKLGDDPAQGGGPEQQEAAPAGPGQGGQPPRHPVVQDEPHRHDDPQREVPGEPQHAAPLAAVDRAECEMMEDPLIGQLRDKKQQYQSRREADLGAGPPGVVGIGGHSRRGCSESKDVARQCRNLPIRAPQRWGLRYMTGLPIAFMTIVI